MVAITIGRVDRFTQIELKYHVDPVESNSLDLRDNDVVLVSKYRVHSPSPPLLCSVYLSFLIFIS